MPRFTRALLLFLLFIFLSSGRVYATCEITSSTSSIFPNSGGFIVNLKNTGSNPISWIKIPTNFSPILDLIPQTIVEAGWTQSTEYDYYTYSLGTLNPNEEVHLDSSGALLGAEEGPVDWTWQTAENSTGDSPDSCTIRLTAVNEVAPTISDIRLSIGNSSASLSWTTNYASIGTVSYGQTTSYGSTTTTSSGTSHSTTLSGLSASTLYHYLITVVGSGGTTSTVNTTFTTSAASVTTVTTTTVTVTTAAPPPIILKDTNSPKITLGTDLSKIFTEAPIITGKVSDEGSVNAGISQIDYSLDGGKNWLPVDFAVGIGKKTGTYEFTPGKLDDGNYLVKVRVKDLSGNTSSTKNHTMIIDRLPPQVGGAFFAIGPMILRPDQAGNIYTLAGLPLKIVLSAVGGPTSLDLFFDTTKTSLTKNPESGLWSGTLVINEAGSFKLKTHSVDGAKNNTDRYLSTIIVNSPGKITAKDTTTIPQAKIKVFAYEKNLNDYILWDGEPYLQQNPQHTDKDGTYKLILPAGKYYLEVESNSKQKQRTEIFETNSPTIINQSFSLTPAGFWGRWLSKTVSYLSPSASPTSTTNTLIGKPLPDFDLSSPNYSFSNTSLLGKPSVISFITSWEPSTSDQLLALDRFHISNTGVNVFAVTIQESVSKTDIFQKLGGNSVPLIADPDGILVAPLSLETLPTHLIVDRKGIIKEVIVGYLDQTNLLKKILN